VPGDDDSDQEEVKPEILKPTLIETSEVKSHKKNFERKASVDNTEKPLLVKEEAKHESPSRSTYH